MELHKRRKALTEPEVRYFLKQILLAVQHLHNEKVRSDIPVSLVLFVHAMATKGRTRGKCREKQFLLVGVVSVLNPSVLVPGIILRLWLPA